MRVLFYAFSVLTDAAVDALAEQRPNGALTSIGGIADQDVPSFLSLYRDSFFVHRAISLRFSTC